MHISQYGLVRATTILVNEHAWPPTYLIALENGTEYSANAEELSLLLPCVQSVVQPAPAVTPPAVKHEQVPLPPNVYHPSSAALSASAPIARPPPSAQSASGVKPSVQAIMDAQRNAKYAVSSLNFDDVDAARKYLAEALRLLSG